MIAYLFKRNGIKDVSFWEEKPTILGLGGNLLDFNRTTTRFPMLRSETN